MLNSAKWVRDVRGVKVANTFWAYPQFNIAFSTSLPLICLSPFMNFKALLGNEGVSRKCSKSLGIAQRCTKGYDITFPPLVIFRVQVGIR